MTILLQWLVEHAWIFYALSAVGAVIYLVRALVAQRERRLALFTLERETATSRLVRAWVMVLVFVAIGVTIFFSTTFILPDLPFYSAGTPLPTPTLAAGVKPLTPVVTPTLSLTVVSLASTSTLTPTATVASVPTPPPPETPTLAPTDTPEIAISGEVNVRFGDFAALVGYNLPATEIAATQPLQLTLLWRALEGNSPVDYQVFTHLLSEDGRLIAQHDGPPVGGTRPTTGWVSGETIVDLHPMAFYDAAYTGPARIAVGLYDPRTGQRVFTDTGPDHVVLPITINVLSP